MSNASTIRRQIAGTQQLTLAPIVSQVGAVTNAFVLNNNGLTLSGGGVIPLVAGVTGLYQGTGQVLHIRAAGSLTTADSSSSALLTLFEVPASVIAAGLTQGSQTGFNTVGASSAVVPGITGTVAFTFDARLQLTASGSLEGQYTVTIYETVKAWTDVTAITGLVGEADLNFVLALTTIASHATSAVLNEFAIDLE